MNFTLLSRFRGQMADPDALAKALADERGPDVIDALNSVPVDVAAAVLERFPHEKAVEVLDQPGLDCGIEIIAALPRDLAASYLTGMAADRVADTFRLLGEPARSELLERLDPATEATLKALLAYPEGSAGAIMTTEFMSVPADWTVAQVLDQIRRDEHTRETVYSIFVVDPAAHTLVHAVPLRRLISGDPQANVLTAAHARKPITITALASRNEAIRLISKYDLLAVAVVDAGHRVIGIVTVDDVVDAIAQRQTEQVQRFGGLEALDQPYMEIGFWPMIRKRGGWLCALFLSEMLTASAMQGFEGELEKAIVLTLFIPLIMSSGGNSGSQATSLLIRALARHECVWRDWWRVALRELPTGVVLGAILGVIGIARITVWQRFGFYDYGEHWMLVALTVGAALVGIVTFGSMTGCRHRAGLPGRTRRRGWPYAV